MTGPVLKEGTVIPVRNKADVLTFMLGRGHETGLFRDRASVRLAQLSQRETQVIQLLLREHIEDVALILAPVQRLAKLPAPGTPILCDPGVMAGHEAVKAFFQSQRKQQIEFQAAIADDAWIRRPSDFILPDKVLNDCFFKLFGTAERLKRDAQLPAYISGVLLIRVAAAAFL